MRLKEYAERNSISYKTAWRLFKNNQIKGASQLPTGTIIINEIDNKKKEEYTIIYSRVSSYENRNNLDSQSKRLEQFCNAKGWIINEIVKECASGLNDNRPKLIKILSERKATRLVVEHKDRLTRFGFNYIKTLYPECEIIVVNESEDKENLLEDFVSLVTSFCARIYGKRRSKRNTERLIRELNRDDFNRET